MVDAAVPPKQGRSAVALTVARAGLLQWFAVNLYEAVVRMPERLATEQAHPDRTPHRGPLSPGSPARFHLPAAPLVLGSSVAALVTGLRDGRNTPALVVGAASTAVAVGLTGVLVRTVNLRLLDDGPPIGEDERRALVRRWHAVNRVRLVAIAAGFAALTRA